jgi:hypothetical protein
MDKAIEDKLKWMQEDYARRVETLLARGIDVNILFDDRYDLYQKMELATALSLDVDLSWATPDIHYLQMRSNVTDALAYRRRL